MESELSLPRNVQSVPDLVRGTDRVSAAMPKRDGRPGKGRPSDPGARRRPDEEPSRDGAPPEQEKQIADEQPAAPLSADSKDKHLDYQA